MGALPARRLRQEKQVDVVHVLESQPYRSWRMYLYRTQSARAPKEGRSNKFGGLHLDEDLEVVPATGTVDGVDAFGVLDVLDHVLQFGGRIGRQARKWRVLP